MIMNADDVLTYFVNFAFDRGISTTLTNELSPSAPSCASAKHRKIVLNMNWSNKPEIPFILVHEISHLINHDKGINYYSSSTIHNKTEYKTNLTAIKLLLNYCNKYDLSFDNPILFCETFGIPTNLNPLVDIAKNSHDY